MLLTRLLLENFRCYKHLDQHFNSVVNIIDGQNGSGKTALLEAIYWQSTGRTFRNHKSRDLIRHEQPQLTVYSEYHSFDLKQLKQLGVQYSRSTQKTIKLNNHIVQKQTDIAHQFPVIAIDPNAFLWVDQSPGFRRGYLDWLVFHVEPQYLHIWKQTQKLQQHINHLLKTKESKDLTLWESKYAELAEQTHQLRLSVFNHIKDRFYLLINQFLPNCGHIDISYEKGWGDGYLSSLLKNKRHKHLAYGYLGVGIHKADITYQLNNKPAHIILSRGQKKMLAVIMYLLFIDIYEYAKKKSPVICIDDMDSELDHNALELLSSQLQKYQRQLFITTVNSNNIKPFFLDCEVFHVEQNRSQEAELNPLHSS